MRRFICITTKKKKKNNELYVCALTQQTKLSGYGFWCVFVEFVIYIHSNINIYRYMCLGLSLCGFTTIKRKSV